MSTILLTILHNIGTRLLTQTFGIWLAKLAAKSTNNMVDDHVVLLLEGGLKNDPEKIEKAAQDILNALATTLTKKA